MAIELTTADTATLNAIADTLGIGYRMDRICPGAKYLFSGTSGVTVQPASVTTVNLTDLSLLQTVQLDGMPFTTIIGVSSLSALENVGTASCLRMFNCNLQASAINAIFEQLPVTTKTATIDVRTNPGVATCDTSIATNKGYTVVTS